MAAFGTLSFILSVSIQVWIGKAPERPLSLETPGCARVWGVPLQLSGLLAGMLPSLFIDQS